MQYKCDVCNDSGSRDKSGDYLDCGHCDAAMQRKSMNDFLDKLPAMVDYDAAWLVHQRALAMAPKQEAPIVQVPYAWVNAGTERQQTEYATLSVGPDNPWMDSANAFPVYAAPAAANGTMPEPVTYMLRHPGCVTGLTESGYNVAMHKLLNMPAGSALVNLYTEDQVRAILAAAGPDAALIEDAKRYRHLRDDECVERAARMIHGEGRLRFESYAGTLDRLIDEARAALSGAKGN